MQVVLKLTKLLDFTSLNMFYLTQNMLIGENLQVIGKN